GRNRVSRPAASLGSPSSCPGLWLDGSRDALPAGRAPSHVPGDGAGMKDYLQRLVQTVNRPAESVHPWAGSIFAASHQGDFNVVQTEELAPASAVRPPPEEVSPAAAQSSGELASTETSPPGAARNSLIPELRPAQNIQDFTAADHRANLGPLVSE